MKRTISMLVGILSIALIGHLAQAANYSEDQVVKHFSIKRTVPKFVLLNPAEGQMRADIYFEFLILKDSSLWIRPLLSSTEEKVKLVGFEIDRAQPQEIKLNGFVAEEFFAINKHVYLVVKQNEVQPSRKRFLIELNPKIGVPPKLTRAVFNVPVIVTVFLGEEMFHRIEPSLKGAVSAALGIGLVGVTWSKIYRNICDRINGCKASVSGDLGVVKNREGRPLSIRQFIFNPNYSVADVILADEHGNKEFLSQLSSNKACEGALKEIL